MNVQHTRLTHEELTELVRQRDECALADFLGLGKHYAIKCRQAINTIIEHNLKLVVGYVHKRWGGYETPSISLDDIIQFGNIGLIRAAEKYHPIFNGRKIQFSTYAITWIKSLIQREMMLTNKTIHIPIHIQKKEGGMPEEYKYTMVTTGLQKDRTIYGEPEDIFASIPDPNDRMQSADDEKEIKHAISRLPRSRNARIYLAYTLGDNKTTTLEQVGNVYGITRERARQIIVKMSESIRV